MTFLSVDRQISFFNQECPSTNLVTTIRISRKHTAGNLVAQMMLQNSKMLGAAGNIENNSNNNMDRVM